MALRASLATTISYPKRTHGIIVVYVTLYIKTNLQFAHQIAPPVAKVIKKETIYNSDHRRSGAEDCQIHFKNDNCSFVMESSKYLNSRSLQVNSLLVFRPLWETLS